MSEIDEDFYKSVENMNVILSRTLLKTVDISERCVAKIKRLKISSASNKKSTLLNNCNSQDVYELSNDSNDSIGEIDESCKSESKDNFNEKDDGKNSMSTSNSISSYKSVNKTPTRNHYAISLTRKYEKQRQMYEKKRIILSKTEPIYYTTSHSPTSNISRDNYGEQTPQTSQTMSR